MKQAEACVWKVHVHEVWFMVVIKSVSLSIAKKYTNILKVNDELIL